MTPPMESSFEDLPYEVLQTILDYILRPTDLCSLCLVSKHVSDLAYQRLYQDIVIPEREDDPTWSRIETLAESKHLHEIRSLQLGTWPTCHDNPKYCENLNLLIPKLRPNSLQSFVFETNCRPRADYLVLLWKMQRNLKKLYFDFKLCAPAINEIAKAYKTELQRLHDVEELEIDFAEEGEKEASMLFDCIDLKNLRKITLESVVPRSSRVANPTFGSTFFNQRLPRTLTHICFRQMSLEMPSSWELRKFDCLESLTLTDCVNVNSILDSLRPRVLKHLHIIGSDAHPLALSQCLHSFSSLESLSIAVALRRSNFANINDLLVEAITCHRGQLRTLRFSPPERGMAFSTLEHLLTSCQQLETLILGSGLNRLFKGAKSVNEENPDLDTTYISFIYSPKHFFESFAKLRKAWTEVAHHNANLIFSNKASPPSLKFLGFEYEDRILVGGAGYYASELTRHSCFTRPAYSTFYGVGLQDDIKGAAASNKNRDASSSAVPIDANLVPYVLPSLYTM